MDTTSMDPISQAFDFNFWTGATFVVIMVLASVIAFMYKDFRKRETLLNGKLESRQDEYLAFEKDNLVLLNQVKDVLHNLKEDVSQEGTDSRAAISDLEKRIKEYIDIMIKTKP